MNIIKMYEKIEPDGRSQTEEDKQSINHGDSMQVSGERSYGINEDMLLQKEKMVSGDNSVDTLAGGM